MKHGNGTTYNARAVVVDRGEELTDDCIVCVW